MGARAGGGPELSRAAGEEGCSSTKKLPTPHLEKSPTGAQATAMPSVSSAEQISSPGSREKAGTGRWPFTSLLHGGGMQTDGCYLQRPGCSVLSPFPLFFFFPSFVSFAQIPVLFVLPFAFFLMTASTFLLPQQTGNNGFLPPFPPAFSHSFLCHLALCLIFCSPF